MVRRKLGQLVIPNAMAWKSSKTRTTVQAEAVPVALTGPDFQNQICNLWKYTKGKPRAPIVYSVPHHGECEDTGFPLAAEIELAEGIAYIAAVKKGVEAVSASAVGLPNDPHDGLLVYVASNDGVRPEVQNQLQSIARAIQGVESRGEYRLLSRKNY